MFAIEKIVLRAPRPKPWQEGEKIPWNEEGFSRRMLSEHLSQQHDAASRRFLVIDCHVEWIEKNLLGGQPARVLDLGCGPGLYTNRLARIGHTCRGIDFSPASVAYARQQAEEEKLPCEYSLADIRTAEYGQGYDLVMLIFGELNVFRRDDALGILRKARAALNPDGRLLLEPHSFDAVRKIGQEPRNWWSAQEGLFGDDPHVVLTEAFWDEETCSATERFYVIDAGCIEVERFAQSMQAYTDEDYQALIAQAGFDDLHFYGELGGQPGSPQTDFIAITARRG
jgi:SAM-dependent methyltransferase